MKTILLTFSLLASLCCEAQVSNIYSVGIYSAGTSYVERCSLSFPFPPNHFKLTDRSWGEDAHGYTIMLGHTNAPGDVGRQVLEVEYGSEKFSVPLDPISRSKIKSGDGLPVTEGSGDFVQLFTQCASNRGGHLITNTLPVIQASWLRQSRTNQDLVVLDGDHFIQVQKLLEQCYGEPDAGISSSSGIANNRSLAYSPQQIGLLLILTGDSTQTMVSVIEKQKQ